MELSLKYYKAIALIDEAYQQNKETIVYENQIYPKEYLYALRMVDALIAFKPDAFEMELLAARCQHLFRWEIVRNTYPMDRKGYHMWRTFLYTYQANKAGEILEKVGYDNETIKSIKAMIEKKDLRTNAASQLIEDVVCLVFLQYYLSDFIEQQKNDMDKLKRIIRSTWDKMSDKAHTAALRIKFPPYIKRLIDSD